MRTLLGLLAVLLYNVVVLLGAGAIFGLRQWDIFAAVGVGVLVIATVSVIYVFHFSGDRYE